MNTIFVFAALVACAYSLGLGGRNTGLVSTDDSGNAKVLYGGPASVANVDDGQAHVFDVNSRRGHVDGASANTNNGHVGAGEVPRGSAVSS